MCNKYFCVKFLHSKHTFNGYMVRRKKKKVKHTENEMRVPKIFVLTAIFLLGTRRIRTIIWFFSLQYIFFCVRSLLYTHYNRIRVYGWFGFWDCKVFITSCRASYVNPVSSYMCNYTVCLFSVRWMNKWRRNCELKRNTQHSTTVKSSV